MDDEEFDPLTLVASEMSMTEQLLSDLMTALPSEDHSIAEYLIGNLDEQGFLIVTTESAAVELDVAAERIERVLVALQRTGPVGVGARNLRECLLMQLDEIKERGQPELVPYFEDVISNYLTELGEHKFTIIAQSLGASYDCVVAVRDFIKRHLQPRPLQEPPQGRSWRSPSPTRFVMPDVLIREKDGELEAEVVETYRFSLRISPLYQQLSAEATRTGQAMSDKERDHIRRYVNRSKLFISNINQRRETMLRITNCLIMLQEDFIRNGVRSLRR
jgi:RNA polymerase sigma-54 factor